MSTRQSEHKHTDWDLYYNQSFKYSGISRSFTEKRLLDLLTTSEKLSPSICELGGANSCFYQSIMEKLKPSEYHIVDSNMTGLDKFRENHPASTTGLHKGNVLNLDIDLQTDIVFSVGLIEHFTPEDTARAIEAHFRLAKQGGLVVISFPTPTWLYRISRKIAESSGQWIFHDERPLLAKEVLNTTSNLSALLHSSTIWPIMFTQRIMAFKKK